LAVTYNSKAPVIRITASGDSVSGPIRLRGVKFVHTTNGTVRIAAGSNGTTNETIYFARTTGTFGETDWFNPPLVLNDGLKVVSMTGTELLLYI
jgi:hypothetical protein